jgi:hypothetical protein
VTELNEHEQIIRRALEQFTATVTIPVLYDRTHEVDQVGTGTLLTLADRYFLITARHLFEDYDPGRFAIPKGRINADLHSLGPFNLYQAKEPEFDIAILELQEEFTLSYVKTGWQVLQLENIGPASPIAGEFVLCGDKGHGARKAPSAAAFSPFSHSECRTSPRRRRSPSTLRLTRFSCIPPKRQPSTEKWLKCRILAVQAVRRYGNTASR